MPTPSTRSELLDLLRESGVCPPDTLARLTAHADRLPNDPIKLAAQLVRQGVLTQFQAKLLLAGRYRGFKLGPYVIKDQIGRGGMGIVYLADHPQLRRRVAVKVMAAGEGADRVAVERFFREARAAAALDHPNIVKVYDVGQQGGTHYLVMEYVEGQTLSRLVDRAGPIAYDRAAEFVAQAAAGLQHAHERGIVHRDVKPGNLILTRDGAVKVLDMGLARSLDPADRLTEQLDPGAVVGTADYIAPEQAVNSSGVDARADVYGLGATFFALVTGRPPFDGTTAQKLVRRQTEDPPPLTRLDRTFPAGLAAVVAKMLRNRPEDRYQSAAEVIAALAPWAAGGAGAGAAGPAAPRGTPADGEPGRGGRPGRERWAGAAAAAVGLAVVAGGLAGDRSVGLAVVFGGLTTALPGGPPDRPGSGRQPASP